MSNIWPLPSDLNFLLVPKECFNGIRASFFTHFDVGWYLPKKNFITNFCGWSSTASTLLNQYVEITSGIVLSQPWSHPAILNQGPLDWKSSSLNTWRMQDEMQIKLFKNEQLTSFTPEWRYWWSTVAAHLFLICKVSQKKWHLQSGYVIIIWYEGTMNHCKKVCQFKTILCLVGHNFRDYEKNL